MINVHDTNDIFQNLFGTDEDCADYLYGIKWPKGFSCSRCGHRHAYTIGTRRLPLFECRHCRYQSSLTSGTVMEGSRTGLRKWFMAIFLMSRTDCGTTAIELSQTIHVTYKTAWLMLHKIRYAMTQADQEALLSGIVRVNATAYGKPHNPSVEAHRQEHPLLVAATIDDDGHPAYVKIKRVHPPHMNHRLVTSAGIQSFSAQFIEPQSTDVQFITGRYNPKRFKRLLAIATDANKWINSTFHGLGRKHLQAYLDEFAYRRNLSTREVPIFFHLMRQCIAASSVTYSSLINFKDES